MARPSKWSDREWAEASRLLAGGMSYSGVAKKTGISKPSLVGRFSDRLETIKDVAGRLATAEADLKSLPISDQVSVRTLADQLRDVSESLVNVAKANGKTAEILAGHAHRKAQTLDPDQLDGDDVRLVVGLAEGANRASSTGLGLLQANKGVGNPDAGAVTLGSLLTLANRGD